MTDRQGNLLNEDPSKSLSSRLQRLQLSFAYTQMLPQNIQHPPQRLRSTPEQLIADRKRT